MTFRTHTHDLTNRVVEIEARLEEIEERQEQIKHEVAQELGEDQSVADAPDHYHNEWEDLELEKTEIKGERRKFLDAVVHWMTELDITENPDYEEVEEYYEDVDECIFETKELSYGQIQSVQDQMMEESFELDIQNEDMSGSPKQGFMQIELLREAIEDWPEEAPTQTRRRTEVPSPGDYPEPVADWLFDRVDALNTTQEEQLGNTSLSEEMS